MADFVRMPDGSLILMGNVNRPVAVPSRWDRVKATLSRFLPHPQVPSPPPWWIPQPPPPSTSSAANSPATGAASISPTPKVDPWSSIEREAAHEERLARELGDFSNRVMQSKPIIEGRWFY